MRIALILMLMTTMFLFGCQSPPTEPLPTGDKGKAITALIETLRKDDNPAVRATAAQSLGRLKCKYADEALIHAMQADPNYSVKLSAIRALGMLGGAKATSALTQYQQFVQYPDLKKEITASLEKICQK
jgi:HEAT repeat protein